MNFSGARRAHEHLHTLAGLWRHPSVSRETLVRYQNRKLRFLISHAYENVPYYRGLFDSAGIRPHEIRCAADLERVPVTSKTDIREQRLGDIVARGVDADRLILHYTSGSTGEPARIRRTEFEEHLLNMFRIRALRSLGRRLRDRSVSVSMAPGLTDRLPRKFTKLKEALRILRGQRVSCLQATGEIVSELVRLSPDVISGYPGALTEVAAVWPEVRDKLRGPRLLFAGGEVMTRSMRQRISEGFQAPVFNIYGTNEFNLLGWECVQTGGMHLCEDNVIFEVMKDGRPAEPGESGDVLVTGLNTYAHPYIRYAIDDIVTREKSPCACGSPFAGIRNIRGRVMDYCILPGGRKMHHWELIPTAFWEMPWYRRYQLVQKSREEFVLRVVLDGEPPDSDITEVETDIKGKIGPGGSFRIEFVDELALGQSGKHQACRSEVVAS